MIDEKTMLNSGASKLQIP